MTHCYFFKIIILQLPHELLVQIFKYIPDHLPLREVCKTFNEISCSTRLFKLQLKSQWNDSYTKFLDNDEIFHSMLKTQRRINSIEISCESLDRIEINSQQIDRLAKVVQYFSVNLKHLEISGNVLSFDILKLLILMPNIEKLSLRNIGEMNDVIPSNFELSLLHLKQFESMNCSINVLKCFDSLSNGVLHKIELVNKENFVECNQNIKLFKNQENLKEIVATTNLVQHLSLHRTKLESMTLKGPKIPLAGIINGQCMMTKFASEGICENDLVLICNELRSLRQLEMSSSESRSSEFAQISKLTKLEKLKISMTNTENSVSNESLSFLESKSLLDLDIFSYHNELLETTMESLGNNCPRLRKLKIYSRSSLNVINPIVNYFPYLTDLDLNGLTEKAENPFVFKCKSFHQNLKILKLVGLRTQCNDFGKLMNVLEYLEKLSFSMPVSSELLKLILKVQPNLKILSLTPQWNLMTNEHKLTKEIVDVMKVYGMNLKVFKADFRFRDNDIELEKLNEEFKRHYSKVFINDVFAVVEWVMEK